MNQETENTDRLFERKKLMERIQEYSNKRIDTLIISISGGGILLNLETLKYITENALEKNVLLNWSGSFFLLAIIVNFWSQFKSNESSEKELDGIKTELTESQTEKEFDNLKSRLTTSSKDSRLEEIQNSLHQLQIEKTKLYSQADRYGAFVGYTNLVSSCVMTIGLILTLIYFCTTF